MLLQQHAPKAVTCFLSMLPKASSAWACTPNSSAKLLCLRLIAAVHTCQLEHNGGNDQMLLVGRHAMFMLQVAEQQVQQDAHKRTCANSTPASAMSWVLLIPAPIATPVAALSEGESGCHPASFSASAAAHRAYVTNRACFRASDWTAQGTAASCSCETQAATLDVRLSYACL